MATLERTLNCDKFVDFEDSNYSFKPSFLYNSWGGVKFVNNTGCPIKIKAIEVNCCYAGTYSASAPVKGFIITDIADDGKIYTNKAIIVPLSSGTPPTTSYHDGNLPSNDSAYKWVTFNLTDEITVSNGAAFYAGAKHENGSKEFFINARKVPSESYANCYYTANGTTLNFVPTLFAASSDNRVLVGIRVVYEMNGVIYIDNGASFDAYQIFIDNGTSLDEYIPYIDNGTDFDICS
jgi:hypothetical protein